MKKSMHIILQRMHFQLQKSMLKKMQRRNSAEDKEAEKNKMEKEKKAEADKKGRRK